MSMEKVPQQQGAYKQAPAGAPPGQGTAAPRPRAAAAGAPPRGYGAPPGHAPQPPAQPQPQYAPAGGYTAYPQQQQVQPPNVVYGVPQPPPAHAAGYGYQQPQPVVYQQPVGAPPAVMQPMGQWTTGLFDCGEDPSNAILTFCLPCITFGQVAEVVDQGSTSCLMAGTIWTAVLVFFGCPCCVSFLWRTKLRNKYNLPPDQVGDFCLHFWCENCALCQEYRELNNRGLNPSLGWEYHRQQLYAQQMGAPQPVYMQK